MRPRVCCYSAKYIQLLRRMTRLIKTLGHYRKANVQRWNLATCGMHFWKWHKISNLGMSGDIQEVNVMMCLKSNSFYTKYMQYMLLKCFCFFKYLTIVFNFISFDRLSGVAFCLMLNMSKTSLNIRDNAQKPSRVHVKARFAEL